MAASPFVQEELRDLSNLTEEQTRRRKREWNRGPLSDLFPKIPGVALESILDKCSEKRFYYNLSESKIWNSRRFTSIVIAHVRHFYSDYDKLLREELVERYEARKRTADVVWNVLREWCPWDQSNPTLRRCFDNTLVPPSQRDPAWDPMDIDDDDEWEAMTGTAYDDPMDLD